MERSLRIYAQMIVRNEADRYLERVLDSLREFVDHVLVSDDDSSDMTFPLVDRYRPFTITHHELPSAWALRGEGVARDRLLDFALRFEPRPDWFLSIDADEIVSDGPRLRRFLEEVAKKDVPVVSLTMREVWDRNEEKTPYGPLPFFRDDDAIPRPCDMPYVRREGTWWVRVDGGWAPHECPVVWQPPVRRLTARERWEQGWTIPDRKLACGREPEIVRMVDALASGVDLLHLGWSNPEERQRRYERYVRIDGGEYHASDHIRSIMEEPTLVPYPKPNGWH